MTQHFVDSVRNLQGLSYVELGMLREVIDKLCSREQWQAWQFNPDFRAECYMLARELLREFE